MIDTTDADVEGDVAVLIYCSELSLFYMYWPRRWSISNWGAVLSDRHIHRIEQTILIETTCPYSTQWHDGENVCQYMIKLRRDVSISCLTCCCKLLWRHLPFRYGDPDERHSHRPVPVGPNIGSFVKGTNAFTTNLDHYNIVSPQISSYARTQPVFLPHRRSLPCWRCHSEQSTSTTQ